jgi:hypothetical protein
MNKFLFITHLTPKAKRSSLRESLISLWRNALEKQSYPHWKSLVIGEEEKRTGKYFELRIDPALGKSERRRPLSELYERQDVKDYVHDADYVIKIDDDDIISPLLLEKLVQFDGDLFYDDFHTFYDISSGQLTQQQRPWIASTCVHKREHAFSKLNPSAEENIFLNSVFYSDHSKIWHNYYRGKRMQKAKPQHPVYLRVLSPTSITSGTKKFPLGSVADVDFLKYYEYLRLCGDWAPADTTDFSEYMNDLAVAWESFSGAKQRALPRNNVMQNLLESFKRRMGR